MPPLVTLEVASNLFCILYSKYVNFIQNICESLGPAHTKGKDLPRMWIPEGGESFGATTVSEFFDDRIRNFLRQ